MLLLLLLISLLLLLSFFILVFETHEMHAMTQLTANVDGCVHKRILNGLVDQARLLQLLVEFCFHKWKRLKFHLLFNSTPIRVIRPHKVDDDDKKLSSYASKTSTRISAYSLATDRAHATATGWTLYRTLN